MHLLKVYFRGRSVTLLSFAVRRFCNRFCFTLMWYHKYIFPEEKKGKRGRTGYTRTCMYADWRLDWRTLMIAIPIADSHKESDEKWIVYKESERKRERRASRGAKRSEDHEGTNEWGRFAAIALPRSYRPVLPRLHLARPIYIYIYTPVHVYVLLSYLCNAASCPTRSVLPRSHTFLRLLFLRHSPQYQEMLHYSNSFP